MKYRETDRLGQIIAIQGKFVCHHGRWKKVTEDGKIWTSYGMVNLRNYLPAEIQIMYDSVRDEKPEE